MPRLPRVRSVEVVRVLKKAGFIEDRQKGSHLILWHPVKNLRVTVPMHVGRIIALKTLKSIIKQANLRTSQFAVRSQARNEVECPLKRHSTMLRG